MNYGRTSEEITTELSEAALIAVKQSRINNTCIPIEYDTALKIIELGVHVDQLWNLITREGFSGTCYYYPMTNLLSAQRGLYMGTKDEIALEVAMLPTREARFQYLKSIRYGARGGHCDFD